MRNGRTKVRDGRTAVWDGRKAVHPYFTIN